MTDKDFNNQIDQMVKVIVKKYQPEKIILFGSAARGEMGSDSDVDLFIVKESHLPRDERGDAIYDILWQLKGRPPVDVLVYTPQEVSQRLELGDWFVKRVFLEGQVMYDAVKRH